jgi:hypothetical protein
MRTRLTSGIVAAIVALGAAVPAVGLANDGHHHTKKDSRHAPRACKVHKHYGHHRGWNHGKKRGWDRGRKCGFPRTGQTGNTGTTGQTGNTGTTGQTGWTHTTKHHNRWS